MYSSKRKLFARAALALQDAPRVTVSQECRKGELNSFSYMVTGPDYHLFVKDGEAGGVEGVRFTIYAKTPMAMRISLAWCFRVVRKVNAPVIVRRNRGYSIKLALKRGITLVDQFGREIK